MKVLVTGKTSFIGRNICKRFVEVLGSDNVYAPSHAELNLLDKNKLTDYLKEHAFDVIVHAAMHNKAFSSPEMLSESLRMFYNLEACRDYYGKLFYFGSGAEYDKKYDIVDVKEEMVGKSIPDNPYGLAKYVMGRCAEHSENIYNLRLFGVYGPHEDWKTKFISNAICHVLKGKPITMQQNVVFDYMHIDDLCNVLLAMINIDLSHHTYNICSGSKISLLEIAEIIRSLHDQPVEIQVKEKEGFKPEYTASNQRLLNEVPMDMISIEDGIKKLYAWYCEEIDRIEESLL